MNSKALLDWFWDLVVRKYHAPHRTYTAWCRHCGTMTTQITLYTSWYWCNRCKKNANAP